MFIREEKRRGAAMHDEEEEEEKGPSKDPHFRYCVWKFIKAHWDTLDL